MQAVRALILALLATSAGSAHALILTSAFDGGWYDPEHAGQGFTFEQIPVAGGGAELLVYFSTFDVDGTPTLLVGQAPITGNVVQMTLNRPVVSGAGANGVLPAPQLIPSGTLRLEMVSCNAGKADFVVNPRPGAIAASVSKIRVGTGSLQIRRLFNTTGQAKRCSGGISDNSIPNEQPESFEKFYLGSYVDARVFYEKRRDRTELNFDLRALPSGNYTMLVDGVQVANFEAFPFRNTTRALVRFASPVVEGARLLDFTPTDRTITIFRTGQSSIRDEFRTPQQIAGLDTQPVYIGAAVGNTSQALESLGATEVGGSGVRSSSNFLIEAEYREDGRSNELVLSVENAEPGFYDVHVEGKRRGTIYVFQRTSGVTFGKAHFRKPVEDGTYALDFDPRGAEISLVREGNLDFVTRILQNPATPKISEP